MGTFFKYVFIIFVIGLIVFSGYTFYKNEKKNTEETLAEKKVEEVELYDNIRLGIASYDNFNPIISKNKNVQETSKLIYDSILTIDKDYNIQTCLATEWSKTGDLKYVVKLRENVKWHDDSEFTAEDIKFTIDKIKDPSIDSIYKANVENISEVQIIDKNTISIILNQEVPFFEYRLIFPIIQQKYYMDEDFISTAKNKVPLGTGEYKISSFDNTFVCLKENTTWWNNTEEERTIKTININLYQTMGELYNAFKSNSIDFVTTSNIQWQDYIGTIGYSTKEFAGREFDYISLNNESQIMKNKAVRKAIALAVDKTNIISNVYGGAYYVAETPNDYNASIYTKTDEAALYNVDQAKQVLVDDGWEYKYNRWQKVENGRYLNLNITLIVNSAYEAGCIASDLIAQDLGKIGIEVTVRQVDGNQYSKYITNKNYDMMLVAKNKSISPDLLDYIGAGNISNYHRDEVINIFEWLKGINNDKVIKEKYDRLVQIYKEDMPFVSLYFNKNIVAYNNSLSGDITPNNFNLFYNIGYWKRQK